MPEPSILDERLAEIDRRLRIIQSGLVPVETGPAAAESPDETGAGAEPHVAEAPAVVATPLIPLRPAPVSDAVATDNADRLAELAEAHERLLELHRELLSQFAEVLERRAGEAATIALTAGPFRSAAAVREFERALAGLPGVGDVVVREYPGGDRVALDVRLTSG